MTPAPVSRRFLAGMIDGFALSVLVVGSFVVPVVLRGFTLPMWGVLVVLLGYAVVPLALFNQTLGLKLLRLELVNAQGFSVDPGNLAFRELLGRGLFPLAYLYTVVGGLLASALGVMQVAMPTGLAMVMVVCCGVAVVGSLFGQVLTSGRTDGRLFADFFAKSFVVEAPARPPPTDADDVEAERETRRRSLRRLVVIEAVLLASVVLVPWAMTARVGDGGAERTRRIKREQATKQFNADPGNPKLARAAEQAFAAEGDLDGARAIAQQHQAALEKGARAREAALKAAVEANPNDTNAVDALVDLYQEAGPTR